MPIAKPVLAALSALIILNLAACKPDGPPPDIIKTQRDALNKAKAVQDVQDKAVQEQLKSVNEQVKAADDQAGQGDSPSK